MIWWTRCRNRGTAKVVKPQVPVLKQSSFRECRVVPSRAEVSIDSVRHGLSKICDFLHSSWARFLEHPLFVQPRRQSYMLVMQDALILLGKSEMKWSAGYELKIGPDKRIAACWLSLQLMYCQEERVCISGRMAKCAYGLSGVLV